MKQSVFTESTLMWMNLHDFLDRIDTADRRAVMDGMAGLKLMCRTIADLSWPNRQILRLQIMVKFRGETRAGYLSVFNMYQGLRSIAEKGQRAGDETTQPP